MKQQINVNTPTYDDLFKLRLSRIIASIFCKLGIHQNWIAIDPTKKEMSWYCGNCGKKANTIETITIKGE